MAENLNDAVAAELARIADLELNEQPEAYSALRDRLEVALESVQTAGQQN